MKWALRLSLVIFCIALVPEPCLGGWPSPSAAGPVAQQYRDGQCLTGRCSPAQSRGLGVGLSVGGWRTVAPRATRPMVPVAPPAPVVPVLFGTDPTPGAGIYVGIIGGYGVTLTCWHAAKHGVASVASQRPVDVTRDKYGYDMAAVFTRPLNVPAARLAQPPSTSVSVVITGFPFGRLGSHPGRVVGYANAESGQPWGDLMINVSSHIGDSGGGVFDRGALVGLLWGTHADGLASSMAVPVPAIADFLRRLRLRCETPDHPTPEPDNELSALRVEIAELRAMIEAITPGQPGPAGPAGAAGADGKDGVSPTIDYAAIAAEVVPLVKPFVFRTLDDSGAEVDREEIRPGDVLNFHHRVLLPRE